MVDTEQPKKKKRRTTPTRKADLKVWRDDRAIRYIMGLISQHRTAYEIKEVCRTARAEAPGSAKGGQEELVVPHGKWQQYYTAAMERVAEMSLNYMDLQRQKQMVGGILQEKLRRASDLASEKIPLTKTIKTPDQGWDIQVIGHAPNMRAVEEARLLENDALAMMGVATNITKGEVQMGGGLRMDVVAATPEAVRAELLERVGPMIYGRDPPALPEPHEKDNVRVIDVSGKPNEK